MARGDLTFFEEALADALETWEAADTIKVALLDNTVAPVASAASPALSTYTEVGAAGTYTAGGTSLGTWGDFVSEAGGTVTFDSVTNPSWAKNASNDTDLYWALVYNDTKSDKALCFVDMGGPVDMTAGAVSITWNASGLGTIS